MKKQLLFCLSILTQFISAKTTHNLVCVKTINSTIQEELWYATKHNIARSDIYGKAACAYLQPEVARALSNAQKEFNTLGLGIKIWDAYRPFPAQCKLFKAVSDPQYVSRPSKQGFCPHTRGGAVDATLVNLKTNKELEMPTKFDDMSPRAHSNNMDLSAQAIKNRTLFHNIMKKHGFNNYKGEWWHFNYKKIHDYPIMDISFENLKGVKK